MHGQTTEDVKKEERTDGRRRGAEWRTGKEDEKGGKQKMKENNEEQEEGRT